VQLTLLTHTEADNGRVVCNVARLVVVETNLVLLITVARANNVIERDGLLVKGETVVQLSEHVEEVGLATHIAILSHAGILCPWEAVEQDGLRCTVNSNGFVRRVSGKCLLSQKLSSTIHNVGVFRVDPVELMVQRLLQQCWVQTEMVLGK